MKALALILVGILAGIGMFWLASATTDTASFVGNYPVLLAVIGGLTVIVIGFVGYQFYKLWQDYRRKSFGIRLKLRLLSVLIMLAVVPGVFIYAVSLEFIERSIESWFNVRVDTALEGGVVLGKSSFKYLLDEMQDKAYKAAADLSDVEQGLWIIRIEAIREQLGADSALIFGPRGDIKADANVRSLSFVADLPDASKMRLLARVSSLRTIETNIDNSRIDLRVVVPIPQRNISDQRMYLQFIKAVPSDLVAHANNVQTAYKAYQQLSLGRGGLRKLFAMTLTVFLLLSLFIAMGLAFVFARRFIKPLQVLAEGTQAVARGDYSPRRVLPIKDELGILTQSFSEMTSQIRDARSLAEQRRADVESSNAYLESVLTNLSAGVLAFDKNHRLRAVNNGARKILEADFANHENIDLLGWKECITLRDTIIEEFSDNPGDWRKQIEYRKFEDQEPKTLIVRGSRLPEVSDGGWVVIFDDITHLISAQRTAAWAEVARRVAHEIKNPLTPIQLSAERMQRKLVDQLDEAGRQLLNRSTAIIVDQVEAMKNLVNAFREYARLPAPEMVDMDMHALLQELASLYEALPVKVTASLGAVNSKIKGDFGQLRQVIHNLLQNAVDACSGKEDGRVDIISSNDKNWLCVYIRDNGDGVPSELLSRVTEPYFTTKPSGSGLGLAIVEKIVLEHQGEMRLTNQEDSGLQIRLRFRPVSAT